MKTTVYPRIGEKVLWETLPNGLPVCVAVSYTHLTLPTTERV